MRIDAYTHFFPKKFFEKLLEVAGHYKDIGKRVRAIPELHDLDVRKKIIDGARHCAFSSHSIPITKPLTKYSSKISNASPTARW